MSSAYQQYLRRQIDQSREFERFVKAGVEPGAYARLHGLQGSARALAVARAVERLERPALVVTPDAESAEGWYDDFLHFGAAGAQYFPMTETLPYEVEEPVIGIVARQYATLYYLLRGESADRTRGKAAGAAGDAGHATEAAPQVEENKKKTSSKGKINGDLANLFSGKKAIRRTGPPAIVVAPIEALQRRVPSREVFERLVLNFQWGDRFDLDEVTHRLVDMGYSRETMTEARGEFSVRGHIVDIFPPQLENPVRFDLFGDEIEAIRFFDPSTQRSMRQVEELERLTVLPVSVHALGVRLANEADAGTLVGLDDWFDEDTLVFLDAPEKYDSTLGQFDLIAQRRYEELTIPGRAAEIPEFARVEVPVAFAGQTIPPPDALFLRRSDLQARLGRFAQAHLPRLDALETPAPVEAGPVVFDFGVTSYDTISPDLEAYLSAIRSKQAQDFSVHVVCDNEGQVSRLEELLAEHEIASRAVLAGKTDESEFRPRELLEGYQDVVVSTGPLHTGFIFPQARLMIVTDREMFGRYKRRHVYRKAPKGRAIASVAEMQRGDFVVHADHGIGRFIGVRRQVLDGRESELLEIEYADDSKLLVPIENVGHVQKYTSAQGTPPVMDRLGSKRWQARRKKSQDRIEEMARELLELYARRQLAEGFSYGEDTVWLHEFEDAFLYTETPDQIRSIDEIKKDMMSEKPMDRLLCGDVGFGKTEVAMRAAFKCVENKKQVAVLAPTTILAQQHYNTFRERFADYPFKIEVMSRFCTDKEVNDAIKSLKEGRIDIIIGTHRLLSQDVGFFDLGLLIVDEEHRFGVRQKERIKSLRSSVDILTLSATPVPRTLHMALSGLRDMSTINTPPRDRQPVRTRVIRFVPEEIEEAVVRELNRGGQIYFVHNRVQTIEQVAQRLTQIVPKARIAIGHGQMHERELEKVMLDFIDRKYDILLATTIIESGLDIPNVNTIIINRADAFGLAQLYQLRGRVGRDVKRAYAYLIVPDGKPITDTAVKRLRAIEEFTELGMGFQIAMRDLEIRGTGNLLGAEQHGVIDAIGFELYCQLLEEAVRRSRGQMGFSPLELPVEIKWQVSAYLPSEYVPVESQRVAFYKRCSMAREARELKDLSEELRDRYGNIPPQAQNLLAVSLLRLRCRQCQIESVGVTNQGFRVKPRGDVFDFLKKAQGLQGKFKEIKQVSVGVEGTILFEMHRWNADAGIRFAAKVMGHLAVGKEG